MRDGKKITFVKGTIVDRMNNKQRGCESLDGVNWSARVPPQEGCAREEASPNMLVTVHVMFRYISILTEVGKNA